jgi:hypothetical protein
MNDDETLPPIPSSSGGGVGAAEPDAGDPWPSAGPAKGLRIRLPIAIACLAVVALAGAAAGAALKKPSSTTAVQAGAVGGNPANGATGANGAAGTNGAAGAAGRFGGPGGGVLGTVTKVEGNTITVTQRDGTTATVVVPSGTTISKTVSGSLSDLTAGTSIAVRGTTTDGKTTAESVTINPANGAFGPGGGVGGARAQSGTATGGGTTN